MRTGEKAGTTHADPSWRLHNWALSDMSLILYSPGTHLIYYATGLAGWHTACITLYFCSMILFLTTSSGSRRCAIPPDLYPRFHRLSQAWCSRPITHIYVNATGGMGRASLFALYRSSYNYLRRCILLSPPTPQGGHDPPTTR